MSARSRLSVYVLALAMAFASGTVLASRAGAVTITEFEIEPGAPLGKHQPRYIHPGPGGYLWYTETGSEPGIGRISPSGERLAEIPDPSRPEDLVAAPDGTVYWTADEGAGRRTPAGMVETGKGVGELFGIALTRGGALRWGAGDLPPTAAAGICAFSGAWGGGSACSSPVNPSPGSVPGMLLGPGGLWVTYPEQNAVRIYPNEGLESSVALEVPVGSKPFRLALGPEGDVWVTMKGAGAVDRFAPDGTRTRFPLPPGSEPNDIVTGPEGALWMTEFGSEKIARMTTSGQVTEYTIPTPGSEPLGITVGPDGNIWFTESGSGKIARLVPEPLGVSGGGKGGGTVGPGGGAAATGPRFTSAPVFSPRRFAIAGTASASAAHKGKGVSTGSELDLGLSEPSTVTATVSRGVPGRRKGRSCVAPGAAPKHAAKCTRQVVVGKTSWKAAAGASKLPFSGRLGGRALKPGAYLASVVAKDASGKSTDPARAPFRVVAG